MNFTYRIDDDLALRLIEPRHTEALFALVDANRDALLPWMRWVNEVTDAQVLRGHISQWVTQTAETGCMSLGIELDGELVGAVFHVRPDMINKQVEVGYWLAQSARGRGAATRAVRAMLDITIRDLGFNRINVRVAPENTASMALAKRLGLTREGVTRQAWLADGRYWDAVEFGVLAQEWEVKSPAFSLTHRIDGELELRLPEPRHAQALYALIDGNREYVARWMSWCTPEYGIADAELFIKRSLLDLAEGKGLGFGIIYRGEYVGGVGAHLVSKENQTGEVGYWLAQAAQGNGVVTRATRAILDYALIDMGLNRVTIHAATENTRSAAIPQRLGFERVGVQRQSAALQRGYVDMIEFAMIAEEWKSKREEGVKVR